MKSHNKYLLSVFLLVLVLFCTGLSGCEFFSAGNTSSDQVNYQDLTVTAVQRFSDQDAKNLRKLFDKDLKKEYSTSALNLSFYDIQGFYGEAQYYQTDNIHIVNQEGSVVATVPCVREYGRILLTFIFNQKGEITQFYWVDGTTPSVSPLLRNDVEISFGDESAPLHGCLTLPSGTGPYPCVVLLPGLTYGDRNEQIGPNMPFRDIAEQLSGHGIAVLRYDRRDYTYSVEMSQLDDYTIGDWILQDLQSALEYLQEQDNILSDYIYVAGHGMAGYLLPMFAEQDTISAGYMLLSPPARTIDQTLYDQTEYVLNADRATDEKAKKTVLSSLEKAMENISSLQAKDTTSKEDLLGLPRSVWLELRGYDPLESVKQITIPLFLVQGGRDYQTSLEDFEAWKEAIYSGGCESVQLYLDNLNHLYMPGTGKSLPSEYQTAGKVSEDVTNAMASFVRHRLPLMYLGNLLYEEPEPETPDLTTGDALTEIGLMTADGIVQDAGM